jgi:hypothetical protein
MASPAVVCQSAAMFTGRSALRAALLFLLSVLAMLPLGCGGNAIENEDNTILEPNEPAGGEEPATEIDEEGPIEPTIEPSGENHSPVDVNGGDVGGGGSSD